MADNVSVCFEEWQAKARQLVEQEGTRFLCLYLDQKTNLLSDSETLQKIGEGKVLKELEDILKSTNEDKENLYFHDHKQVRKSAQPCTSSGHSCHLPPPKLQLSWEKISSNCFVDQSFPDRCYDKLPGEILRNIFSFLKPSDLKHVMLVSENWKFVAVDPALWNGLRLPWKCYEDVDDFFEFFDSPFACKLQHLALGRFQFKFEIDDGVISEFLNYNLKSIEFGMADLSKVSAELLANLVSSCKECDITEYYGIHDQNSDDQPDYFLGAEKIEAIIRSLQHRSKLRSFKLKFTTMNFHYENEEDDYRMRLDLSYIPAEILVTAFSMLKELELINLKLGSEQMRSIAESGLGNLTKLSLCGIQLDEAKLMHLLEALDKTRNMKNLELSVLDVTEIPSVYLSRVINKVERVVLSDIKIETEQIEEIFLGIIRGDSVMKHFVLDYMVYSHHGLGDSKCLSAVNPEVLAKAVNKLESVAFSSSLSTEQSKMMFEVMSLKTNLKSLETVQRDYEIYFPDYHSIDPQVLARALNNLKTVQIDFRNFERGCCNLTWPQLIAFLKQLNSQTNLETILSDRDKIKVEDLMLK